MKGNCYGRTLLLTKQIEVREQAGFASPTYCLVQLEAWASDCILCSARGIYPLAILLFSPARVPKVGESPINVTIFQSAFQSIRPEDLRRGGSFPVGVDIA